MERKNKNKNKRNQRSRNKKGDVMNPAPSALVYSGPFATASTRQNTNVFSLILHGVFTVSSDGAGVIAGNINTANPSSTGRWAALATQFDEFRPLAGRVTFQPVDRYDAPLAVTVAINQPPLLTAIDRDSSTTPSSTSVVVNYESCKMRCLSDPFSMSWKMNGIADATWITTATPSNVKPKGFIWIGETSSATINTTFGYLLVDYIIQFRGST